MLPLLEREVVTKKKWLTHTELADVFALGQSTPGLIAVNVSTFVGVRQMGIVGGFFATFGVVAPSLFIIVFIAYFLQDYIRTPLVMRVFEGIRAVVCGLLICAVYSLSKRSVKNIFGVVVLTASFVLIAFVNVSPVLIIILSGGAGILVQIFTNLSSK